MKISFKWLCEFVEGLDKIDPRDVAKQLTFSGLEVEEYVDQNAKWQGIVVGEVISREQHPNADKLSLCQVSDGQKTFQVVCGAPNVTQGKKYPFATLGTTMPGGLKIAPIKLRGLESMGMLCSAKELELSTESNGLMELSLEAQTGQPVAKALGVDDVILTLNVTPNRGDALSHWGVAKDVAALFGLKVNFDQSLPFALNAKNSKENTLKVSVLDSVACPRYSASQIFGVSIKESPAWLKSRLEILGQRSINNVVDATNYVMLLTGHPVHAFDARQIHNQTLVVKTWGVDGEYKTLDDVSRSLKPQDLMICDDEKPLAIAGVMGGLNSSVQPDTQNLVLEVASFSATHIRHTARRIGLQTESSYRFARFVNPDTVLVAHRILQNLIVNIAGGEASQIQDAYPNPVQPKDILLKDQDITRILGITLESVRVENILKALSFEVKRETSGYLVTVPVGRSDITRAIDLVEEVGRIYGLDQIPAEMPKFTARVANQSEIYSWDQKIKSFFIDQGFNETIHLSFGDEKLFQNVSQNSQTNYLELQNPISEDLKIMRPTILAHLLSCIKKNALHTEEALRFFELRKVYEKDNHGQESENYSLMAVYSGHPEGRNRFGLNREMDFFDGKGLVEEFLNQQTAVFEQKIYEEYPYHPGQSLAYVCEGKPRVIVGALHPEVLQNFKIKGKVFAIEIDAQWFMQNQTKPHVRFKSLSPLPSVYRDMALLVDKSVSYAQIKTVIEKFKPVELVDVRLFDVFSGESLPDGKISMAFSLVYALPQNDSSSGATVSLNDQMVNEKHFALVDKLQEKLGVQLR